MPSPSKSSRPPCDLPATVERPPFRASIWLSGALAATLALGCLGCRCAEDQAGPDPATESTDDRVEQDHVATEAATEVQSTLSLLDIQSQCDVFQQGLVLDLGDESAEHARSFHLLHPEPLARVTHQGRSYARLTQMQTKFLVWLPAPIPHLEVTAQVRGSRSERMAIYVDDERLGAVGLKEDRTDVVRLRTKKSLTEGLHEVIVSLSRRGGRDPEALVSWLRLGPTGVDESDVPPSRSDVFSEMATGGQQEPAVILRHGSLVSCPLWVPEHAKLETEIGVWGGGEAVAGVVVRTAAGTTKSLGQFRIEDRAEPVGWMPISLDLSSFAGRAVEVQLVAERVAPGARLGFSKPRITGQAGRNSPRSRARQVIVFLLSGLGKHHEPTGAAAHGLPIIGALTRTSEIFTDYRTPTTSVTAVVASLLSGQQPWQHGLLDEDQQLDPQVTGLAEALQAAGGRSAFFTGVPLSFAGFGLSRGFEKFISISPVEDRAATAPIDEAKDWLSSHEQDERPRLLFIHLRGGHPPFDIDRDTARSLPPPEYGGDLDARRAAIQLAEIRSRPRGRQRMPEEDWTRFAALQKAALLRQDAAISRFLSWLAQKDLDRDTLIVFMGDVAAGERPQIPFSLTADVSEDIVQTLLLVQHPGGTRAGTSTHLPFSTVDVTKTIAGYLGIEVPTIWKRALDLGLDVTRQQTEMRAQIAYRDHAYATRVGPYLLRGTDGKAPSLCLLSIDPGCLEDRATENPIATRALWTRTWLELGPALSRLPEPIKRPLDPDLEAALTVWGVPR